LAQAAKDSAAEARRNELTARESLYAADISWHFKPCKQAIFARRWTCSTNKSPNPISLTCAASSGATCGSNAMSEDLFSFTGHKDAVESVAFSPDGMKAGDGQQRQDDKNLGPCFAPGSRLAHKSCGTSAFCGLVAER
jgi:hypothetical protein